MDTTNLQNLPADQKIELVYQLWDEIAASEAPMNLSKSVIAEIDKRCAELDADPSIAIGEAEMWRRVNEQ
jgi:putative addiction module component (TIGR02574 family)